MFLFILFFSNIFLLTKYLIASNELQANNNKKANNQSQFLFIFVESSLYCLMLVQFYNLENDEILQTYYTTN